MERNIEAKPKNTVVGRAAELDLVFSSLTARLVFISIWLIGLMSLLALLINLIMPLANQVIGLSCIGLSIFITYYILRLFFLNKIKYPKITTLKETKDKIGSGQSDNVFSIFSFHLAKATLTLFKAKNAEEVSTKELFLTLLSTKDMVFILTRLGVGAESLRSSLEQYPGQKGVINYLIRAIDIAIAETHHQVEIGDVFISLCENDPFFKQFIQNLKLDVNDIANLVYWRTNIVRENLKRKSFFDPDKFKLNGGIGKDWAFGFTPLLRRYSSDITDSIRTYGLHLEIFGKQKVIAEMEEAMLHQGGGNVLIVGEPGIGKKTAVYAFAKKVYEGNVNSGLSFFHIVSIDLDSLLAGTDSPGELTAKIASLFNEIIRAGNIIVFIDKIQNLFSGGGAGKVNAIEAILPYLDNPNIKIIGTCDTASYGQYVSQNPSLNQRFTRVTIEEPPKEDVIRIMEDAVPSLEARTGSIISYIAIKTAADAADRYILNQPNPQKTVSLIDGASAKASAERGHTIILPKDILAYVSEKYNVPSGDFGEEERVKLLNLDKDMHKSVIGQDQAIKAIADALRRARAGVTDTKKPIGSFLFLGPTGVGKTETAKSLAKNYFGSEDRMIRFDMSEYQNKEDIYRLIGSNLHGENNQGVLTTAIREHPFSLLLFDEIEKANRDILDLFLQILDEGRLTDGNGVKVSFTNAIIIATSNAGANLIREAIQGGEEYEKTKQALLNYLQENNIYRPEFLNRFTSVIAFSPISQSEIRQIATLMIEKMRQTVLKNRQVSITVTDDAVDLLSTLGYDPQMGARPMARVVQDKLENFIAEKILTGELVQGSSITIAAKDIN